MGCESCRNHEAEDIAGATKEARLMSDTVKDKNNAAVWAILDDLLDTLKATAPRVYESVLRKIKEL